MTFFNDEPLRYELSVRRAGRWELLEILDDPLADHVGGGRAQATSNDLQAVEAAIIARARLALASAEAAKVTRGKLRDKGSPTETVIFSEERSGKGATAIASPGLRLGQLDGAAPAPCADIAELCRRPAYRVAGQLLRSFLERAGITAFELFHHGPHQRELADAKTLIPGAIERVAKLQGGADVGAVAERKERLTHLVERLRAETARLAAVKLPPLGEDGFAAMASAAGALGSPDTATFRIGAAFSRSLAREPGIPHRIAVVIDCLAKPMAAEPAALLDTFMAGVFDDTSAMTKLLSGHRDRAGTILGMMDLARGIAPSRDAQPTALAQLIANRLLPQTAASLWARIRREIDRGEPLSQFEPTLEREKLGKLRTQLLEVAPQPIRPSLEAGFRRRSEQLRQSALGSGFA